jgi:hypothetical protein
MKPGERAQVVPVELVTEFGSFFFEATFVPNANRKNFQFSPTGQPTASNFKPIEDVRNFIAPEYAEFAKVPRGPSEHGEHPDDGFATDEQIRETIRRNRRAIMPDPGEREKPKTKAELGRKLANTGKPCPNCRERCGPRTKICMCGHNFYQNGAA